MTDLSQSREKDKINPVVLYLGRTDFVVFPDDDLFSRFFCRVDWAHPGLGVENLRLVLSAGGDAVYRLRRLHCLLALRLGEARAGAVKAEFSLLSWAAMLFAAGIGIDLMFFSVAEPVTQYMQPPEGAGQTIEAARQAMVWTCFTMA